jgi:hypothetical protein
MLPSMAATFECPRTSQQKPCLHSMDTTGLVKFCPCQGAYHGHEVSIDEAGENITCTKCGKTATLASGMVVYDSKLVDPHFLNDHYPWVLKPCPSLQRRRSEEAQKL